MFHTLFAIPAVAVFAVQPSTPAEEAPRLISVTGEGKASAPPDMAAIHTGVTTEGGTASAALAANNKAMDQILKTVRDYHIEEKDIQTSRFDVSPVYHRDPKGGNPPEVVGYRVTNQVQVRVRNLATLGKVLDALVRAGSNQVSGVQFGIEDPRSVLDRARRRAVADARHRAELYADAAGVRVGEVRTISGQPVPSPRPFRVRDLAAGDAARVPVAPGEKEYRVQVHIVFGLKDVQRAKE